MTMSMKTLLGSGCDARAQKDTLKPSIFEQFSVLDSLLPQSPAADDENDADTPEDTP